jgi:type IV pilus assembly protein PilW
MKNNGVTRNPRRHGGFSLIELMIAVALGLIVLAALTAFFVQTSANRTELERNTRQLENGRYALDVLRDDLSLAGFYSDLLAGIPQASLQWKTPQACPATVDAMMINPWNPDLPSMPVPLFGYPSGVDPDTAGPGMPLVCLPNYKDKTDILVVRRFSSEPVPPGVAAVSPFQWYAQASRCAQDIGDFKVPYFAAALGGPYYSNAVQGVALVGWQLRKLDCVAPADLWRVREQVYYIRNCSDCGKDTIPTLVRMELDGGLMKASPLVEGIDDMRLEYGIDDAPRDGKVDRWTRCDPTVAPACDANTWANALAVKVYLLARNVESTPNFADNKTYSFGLFGTEGPFNDAYKRHMYSAHVVLPNRAGPREAQLVNAP